MAHTLCSCKQLPELMMTYRQLESKQQPWAKFESEYNGFHSRNVFEMSGEWQPFCLGMEVLTLLPPNPKEWN